MLPALAECWHVTDAAALDPSDDVGSDLEALIDAALSKLDERSVADRIRNARSEIADAPDQTPQLAWSSEMIT